MSNECTPTNLFISYKNLTTPLDRALFLEAHKMLGTITEHDCPAIYSQIWDFFVKDTVEDLDRYLTYKKPGFRPLYFTTPLEQGHHIAPMYWPHAKNTFFKGKNPIEVRYTWSKYGADRPEYQTDEQYKQAMEADAHASHKAWAEFQKMVIGLLFNTPEAWKKLELIDSTAGSEKGLNVEQHDIYFKKNAHEGYDSWGQNLSIEKNFKCWDETTGEFKICCEKNAANCKPYVLKINVFEDIVTALQKAIIVNVKTSKKTTIKEYTAQGRGSEDMAKYMGWLIDTKKALTEAATTRTIKYNIGYAENDKNAALKTALTSMAKHTDRDIGLNGGEAKNPQFGCYNPVYADLSKVILFMHWEDAQAIDDYKLIPPAKGLSIFENIANYLGIKSVFVIPEAVKGKFFIISQKTLGIHPVGEDAGTAEYKEHKLKNIWWENKFHLILWPFLCFVITCP